jgi:hypothetical protein
MLLRNLRQVYVLIIDLNYFQYRYSIYLNYAPNLCVQKRRMTFDFKDINFYLMQQKL